MSDGVITPEIAKQDIEKMFGVFVTFGPGSDIDRAAQLVLQTIQVLSRRLDKPSALKILYIDNKEASAVLPAVVIEAVERLAARQISIEQAAKILGEVVEAYSKAFVELGVSPEISQALIMK